MTTIDFGNETRLQEWTRKEFGLTYGCFCALVALVAGHRVDFGCAIRQGEIEKLVVALECRRGWQYFPTLERLGLIVRAKNVGKTGLDRTWHPTARGIERVLPSSVARLHVVKVLEEMKSGPGLVNASSEIVEEERAAG